jgi:hypothetical protein
MNIKNRCDKGHELTKTVGGKFRCITCAISTNARPLTNAARKVLKVRKVLQLEGYSRDEARVLSRNIIRKRKSVLKRGR